MESSFLVFSMPGYTIPLQNLLGSTTIRRRGRRGSCARVGLHNDIAFGDDATYGRVLEYSEPLDKSIKHSPEGGEMEHLLREAMSFGDGLAVLEAQSKLLDFLLAVVSKILVDLDLTNPTPAEPLSAPAIPIAGTAFQWQSSARENALRPYSSPPKFSIDEISELLAAQYELAVQHLADLRTDPMYLAETMRSYCDHRIETILQAPPQLVWNRAVGLMLSDAYSFFVFYHVAKEIISEFCAVQRSYPNGPSRARELPQDYENALKKLHPLLSLIETHITKVHHQTLCASSLLHSGRSVRRTDQSFTKNGIALKAQPQDKLYMYFRLLLEGDQVHLWQITRIFDQIDRITQDPVEHQRLSPLIANFLSQWGVVNDCKSILGWHRPAVEETEEVIQGVQQRLQKWHPLLATIISGRSGPLDIADQGFPASRFLYPKGPRDATWASRCQHVDDNFSKFWKGADKWLVNVCDKELWALATHVLAPFAVTPTDWVALVTSTSKSQGVREQPSPAALMPFGGALQNSAAREEVKSVKNKPKTRGVAAEMTQDTSAAQQTEEIPTVPTPKAYKVFSTLFNATNDESIATQQGSVAWKDILTTFAELEFKLNKARGSAWTFHHSDRRRSITIHEPHPEPTMRFWEVRRFGRRLAKRFGWTLDTFVVASAPV